MNKLLTIELTLGEFKVIMLALAFVNNYKGLAPEEDMALVILMDKLKNNIDTKIC